MGLGGFHPLFTVGYQRWHLDDFVERVLAQNCSLVVDIRREPSSQRREWSGDALAAYLSTRGMRYLHLPALGNVNYQKRGTPIQLADPHVGIPLLLDVLSSEPATLLCTCPIPRNCHRWLVATLAKTHTRQPTRHLCPPAIIRGVTLLRPWPGAILRMGKRIENRSYPPYKGVEWLALHSGQGWDEGGARWIEARFGEAAPDTPPGCIVAVARLGNVIQQSNDPWFIGSYGWGLTEVVPIAPLPCSGQRKLWVLERPLLTRVRAAYREAISATTS